MSCFGVFSYLFWGFVFDAFSKLLFWRLGELFFGSLLGILFGHFSVVLHLRFSGHFWDPRGDRKELFFWRVGGQLAPIGWKWRLGSKLERQPHFCGNVAFYFGAALIFQTVPRNGLGGRKVNYITFRRPHLGFQLAGLGLDLGR